jgi:hypothetical protein
MPEDAVMVEAGESGDEQNTVKPPNIFDSSALLVHLEGKVNLFYVTAALYCITIYCTPIR